jgi:hypothetical protein
MAAATPIDSLFRPSTQFLRQDENQPHVAQHFSEFELLPHLTLEAILASGITWYDFLRFILIDKVVVRMARDVYVCSFCIHPYGSNHVLTLGDDLGGLVVDARPGTATETVMATCNFLVRLLATSEKRNVYVQGRHELLPVSGSTLSHLFESRENLIRVALTFMLLNIRTYTERLLKHFVPVPL